MFIERKALHSLHIDVEKGIFLLNEEDMSGTTELRIDFDNGKWTLLVTKEEVYSSSVRDAT